MTPHNAERPRSRKEARLFTRGPSHPEHAPADIDHDAGAGRLAYLRGGQLDLVTNFSHASLRTSARRDLTRDPRVPRVTFEHGRVEWFRGQGQVSSAMRKQPPTLRSRVRDRRHR